MAYEAIRRGAGLIKRADRRLIGVSGTDRGDYLQGQLTNDILALGDGDVCYAAYLTPQGRMIADMYVCSLDPRVWLDVHRTVKDLLVTRFEELIFAEDVRIIDADDRWSCGVAGPRACERLGAGLAGLGIDTSVSLASLACRRVAEWRGDGVGVIVARTDAFGVPGYDAWFEGASWDDVRSAFVEAGCVEVDAETVDVVRVEHGLPMFPVDMDDTTIPLEAGIEDRAISFTKGCYVGQEVIVRVVHRGHGRVARRLVGVSVAPSDSDARPGPGTVVMQGDREVGRLTSVVFSPTVGRLIALGYVTRDLAEPGTPLEVDVPGVGRLEAEVVALPFVRSS